MRQIIDVSSVIYGGHYGNDRRINGFPVGGLIKLMGILNANIGQREVALCFDGDSIIKKELLPTYKSGRIPDFSVYAQIELLKEILLDCNIPFYFFPQYEADDLVYSLCHYISVLGCTDEISIISDDRDLACCVAPNVSIQNVTTNGKCIDYNNYSDRVVSGKKIPYNSILIWKLFYGDKSDNYKGVSLRSVNAESFIEVWSSVCEAVMNSSEFTPSATAHYSMFDGVLRENFPDVSDEEKRKLLELGRVVFPYEVPEVMKRPLQEHLCDLHNGVQEFRAIESTFKFANFESIDRGKFKTYCDALGVNRFKNYRRGIPESEGVSQFLDLLSLRARELSSGEFIAQHAKGKPVETPKEFNIKSMELPL